MLVRRLAQLLTLLLALPAALGAQQLPWQVQSTPGAPTGPVVYQYPEQVELKAGQSQVVELHFAIQQGLHINSHTPKDKSLLRTELIVAEPPEVVVQSVTFPDGTPYTSKAFPGHPLSVYAGELVLQARITASKPGDFLLPAALRYQACDVDSCFPPKKAPVSLDVVVR